MIGFHQQQIGGGVRQGVRGVAGGTGLHAQSGEQVRQGLGRRRARGHHAGTQPVCRADGGEAFQHFEGKAHPEDAALPRGALHADVTAHEGGELMADGEAQAGAAVLAVGGAVHLGEGLEEPFLAFLRDADARVPHGETHPAGGPFPTLQPRVQDHLSYIGELHRVAHQVNQDLPQTPRVAAQAGGQGGVQVAHQFQSLALGAFRQ